MNRPWRFCSAGIAIAFMTASAVLATPTPSPGPLGRVEGKLIIQPQRGVHLADDAATTPAGEHALVVRSKSGAMKPRDVTPDDKGWFGTALPPGDYILELKGSGGPSQRRSSSEKAFTVTAGETVWVDLLVPSDLRQMQ